MRNIAVLVLMLSLVFSYGQTSVPIGPGIGDVNFVYSITGLTNVEVGDEYTYNLNSLVAQGQYWSITGGTTVSTGNGSVTVKWTSVGSGRVAFVDADNRILTTLSVTVNPMRWEANSTSVYVLDKKVGIGTSSPSYHLQVTGDIYAASGWYRFSGQRGLYSQSYGTYFQAQDANYWKVRSDRGMMFYNKAGSKRMGYVYHDNNDSFGLLDGDGNWGIKMDRDTDTRFYINNSEKMIINSSGNVGIGTSLPSQKLHVYGDSYLQGRVYIGSTDTYFYRDAANRIATSDMFYVQSGSPATYLYSTNTYLGAGSGDNIHLRGNTFSWTSGGGGIINASGNVGIGTTAPSQKLEVAGNIKTNAIIFNDGTTINSANGLGGGLWQNGTTTGDIVYNSGKVGIGISNPSEKLEVAGNIMANIFKDKDNSSYYLDPANTGVSLKTKGSIFLPYGENLYFGSTATANTEYFRITHVSDGNTYMDYTENLFFRHNGVSSELNLLDNGRVGIHTSVVPEGYRLGVGGKVICEELTIKLKTDWPDYVFDNEYDLPGLNEVEEFINTNKHLPDVPSASQVANEGVDMGEMNKILLQKIEELMLYTIQQQKEIDELKEQLNSKL